MIFELFLVLLLVLGNGFFVAAEFALVKVRSTQLEILIRKGSYRATIALNLLENLDGYLSASQLGITLTSLGLGWLGEPVVAAILERGFVLIGVESEVWSHRLALPIGFAIITFLHIVVGEMAPKSIAIQRAQATTLAVAIPFRLFYRITYPLVWLLNSCANLILSWMGLGAASEHQAAHSVDELHLLVSESEKGKKLSLISKDILLNTLDLRRRLVRDIMVPRGQISWLSVNSSLDENLAIAKRTQHTRFPLCDPDLDNIIGLVHLKDVLWLVREKGDQADLRTIARPALFVPELAVIEKILRSFQGRRIQAAIVVDEYGVSSGLITFENIIEEIVGDVQDEFDSERPLWQKIGENDWLIDGAAPLYEVKGHVGIDISSKDATTIGGYIVERLGRMPREGDVLEEGQRRFIVKVVDRRRIRQLLLTDRAS